jgi:hypothetical protein
MIYNVTLHDGVIRNVLSPMSEQHLYRYLMCRALPKSGIFREVPNRITQDEMHRRSILRERYR